MPKDSNRDRPCNVPNGEDGSLQSPRTSIEGTPINLDVVKRLTPIEVIRFDKVKRKTKEGKEFTVEAVTIYSQPSRKYYQIAPYGEDGRAFMAMLKATLEIDSTARTFSVEKSPDNKLIWTKVVS